MFRLVDKYLKLMDILDFVVRKLLLVFAGLMTAVVILQVLCRYVLKSPLVWTEEVARYLMLWMAFTGASCIIKKWDNIYVDFFINMLNKKPRKIIMLLQKFVIGMWMDTGAAIILFAPILAPIAVKMGVHPIHFAIMMITNLAVGLITPPVGVVLYATAAVGKASFINVCKATAPYMVIGFAVVAFMTLCPDMVLFLPKLLGML
jgi:TRAP-type C4-dicarboxylate transport system permease large subunit